MQRILFIVSLTLYILFAEAQSIGDRLNKAFNAFESDAQLRSGISALYVTDSKTRTVIFDKNGSIGLAPASTQKVITAASAYELLGKGFRYNTAFGYTGSLSNGQLNGMLIIRPSGDPTLGSWRWETTREGRVMQRLSRAVKSADITNYAGIAIDGGAWNSEAIPDGWIWQDIGNYYGAGAHGLNWRENQYDVMLRSGKTIGSEVTIAGTKPLLYHYKLTSELRAAAKGTGDNAYIYFPLGHQSGIIRGTIPAEEASFTISGAMPSPRLQFAATLEDSLKRVKITNASRSHDVLKTASIIQGDRFTLLHTEVSPPLDSVIYWFNRRSINLYGEALMKTIAFQKKGKGETDEGVELVKDFWKEKGIHQTELNMVDGSGLSPLNRVSAKAQVAVLQHAKGQPWFEEFFHSPPEFNNMKMKSGTIRGVRAYCGYHRSGDGKEYVFSFIVNNYNGSSSSLVQKMYKVLDVLK